MVPETLNPKNTSSCGRCCGAHVCMLHSHGWEPSESLAASLGSCTTQRADEVNFSALHMHAAAQHNLTAELQHTMLQHLHATCNDVPRYSGRHKPGGGGQHVDCLTPALTNAELPQPWQARTWRRRSASCCSWASGRQGARCGWTACPPRSAASLPPLRTWGCCAPSGALSRSSKASKQMHKDIGSVAASTLLLDWTCVGRFKLQVLREQLARLPVHSSYGWQSAACIDSSFVTTPGDAMS